MLLPKLVRWTVPTPIGRPGGQEHVVAGEITLRSAPLNCPPVIAPWYKSRMTFHPAGVNLPDARHRQPGLPTRQ
jgi:hypothetical protein